MKSIFKNREYLRPSYTPEELPHRDEQIRQLALVLVAPLRGETPSNLLIYGKPGTGKTVSVKYVAKELERAAYRAPQRVEAVYLNCEMANTQYRILATLANVFLEKLGGRSGAVYPNRNDLPRGVPMTGWPTDEVYRCLFQALEQERQLAVVVLDEIDKLVLKGGDEVLYNLTRMNSDLKNSRITIVGISNDLNFMGYLDPASEAAWGKRSWFFPHITPLNSKTSWRRGLW